MKNAKSQKKLINNEHFILIHSDFIFEILYVLISHILSNSDFYFKLIHKINVVLDIFFIVDKKTTINR